MGSWGAMGNWTSKEAMLAASGGKLKLEMVDALTASAYGSSQQDGAYVHLSCHALTPAGAVPHLAPGVPAPRGWRVQQQARQQT